MTNMYTNDTVDVPEMPELGETGVSRAFETKLYDSIYSNLFIHIVKVGEDL